MRDGLQEQWSGPATRAIGGRRSTRRRELVHSVVAVIAVLLIAAACSSSNPTGTGPTGTFATAGTSPPPSGNDCDDPTGDLATDSRAGGSLSEPASIDLIHAESVLTPDTLKVSFSTAGRIDGAANTAFIVGQGTVGNPLSFEIRAFPAGPAPSPPWTLQLVTYSAAGDGKAPLAATVLVKENTLSYEIPLSDLPPVATLIWQFGAAAGEGDSAIYDDCDTLRSPGGSSGTRVPGTAAATTPTAPPTTAAPISFGTEQTYTTTGSKVTVYAAESPVANPKPLPPEFDLGQDVQPAVVDAQICAGPKGTEVRAGSFQLKATDNRVYTVPPVPYGAKDPAFPQARVLQPADCIRGYVTFLVPPGTTIGQVFYSPESSARNFLAWKAP